MKKAIVLVGMFVLALTACGEKKEEAVAPVETAPVVTQEQAPASEEQQTEAAGQEGDQAPVAGEAAPEAAAPEAAPAQQQ